MDAFGKHISDSAFLVNESRARNVPLSRDRFAHLWVTKTTRRLWEDFSRAVYPHDDIELGVRNRFFLERLASFVHENPGTVFVNMGAGFTSYPYLIDEPFDSIEIDYGHVVEFKREKIQEWQSAGSMPERAVAYIAADLQDGADLQRLRAELAARLAATPSFILMEGLTYYLSREGLDRILDMCAAVQGNGSVAAFDFWTPDTSTHPTFSRFRAFFEDRFGHAATRYNLFDIDFVRSIRGYTLVAHADVQTLEGEYAGTSVLARYDEILPEHYVLLKREMSR
jgi:O-methyltransferase involved in polyketide biosynthesis